MEKHKWIFKFLDNGGRHLACKKCMAVCDSENINEECNESEDS